MPGRAAVILGSIAMAAATIGYIINLILHLHLYSKIKGADDYE